MELIKKITEIPENFLAFLAEMLPEYTALYGAEAGAQYSEMIRPSLAQTLSDGHTVAYALMVERSAVGMVIGAVRSGAGHIHFIHVLSVYRGLGVESKLLAACVEAIQLHNPDYILVETIPLYSVQLDAPFLSMGFRVTERLLMECRLTPSGGGLDVDCTRALLDEDEVALAQLLNEVYAAHEDRVLHHELQQQDVTLALIRRYRSGAYGRVDEEWVRILCDSRGVCFGGIMGHGVSETTGYIYQLAVHPAHQQQGHGGHLMWSLLSVMAAAGIKAVLLGVTKESVAAGLYVALGFRVKHAVPVYTWDKNNR